MKMNERQIKLVIGSLLHDLGKVIYRTGTTKDHSTLGYEFLKDTVGIQDQDILHCVKYHHAKLLKYANIPNDDLCYITYFADNVAAGADRREAESGEYGFDPEVPLSSVFNILNGNSQSLHYKQSLLDLNGEINYPTDQKIALNTGFYKTIEQNFIKNLQDFNCSQEYIPSILSLIEANLSYIPSSTNKSELIDIPLYDHLKLTAAFASCIERYFTERGISDYKQALFSNSQDPYNENMFILFSMDISGIQNFIYTITTDNALKGLRARSIYLEIMMEHLIDELLDLTSLSRANLIYAGGGHCYMILPNTPTIIQTIKEFERDVNHWFLKNFDIALFVGIGYAECNANSLMNKHDQKDQNKDSYTQIFRKISKMISGTKMHRYSFEDLCYLNNQKHHGARECSVCKRLGNLNEENRCFICAALEKFALDVMHQNFFTITSERLDKNSLPLPLDKYLVIKNETQTRSVMEDSNLYVRLYTKNKTYMGDKVHQNLWIADYCDSSSFEELAEKSKANDFKKIAVLRADVDNLGNTFVNGFKRNNNKDERYVSLTRSAVLSRQLSLFFKGYITNIFKQPSKKTISGTTSQPNIALTIVYSGGDDVFLVGAWNEVIDAFIELRSALRKFAQNTISISGGIGVYDHSYPINVMAQEVAHLKDCSKELPNKDAITLFDANYSFKFDNFINKVIEEKFNSITKFFEITHNHGNAFLYRILELFRDRNNKINFARLVYLLSRLEPQNKNDCDFARQKQNDTYAKFAKNVYEWSKQEQDISEFIVATYLYVYLTRNKEKNNGLQ